MPTVSTHSYHLRLSTLKKVARGVVIMMTCRIVVIARTPMKIVLVKRPSKMLYSSAIFREFISLKICSTNPAVEKTKVHTNNARCCKHLNLGLQWNTSAHEMPCLTPVQATTADTHSPKSDIWQNECMRSKTRMMGRGKTWQCAGHRLGTGKNWILTHMQRLRYPQNALVFDTRQLLPGTWP